MLRWIVTYSLISFAAFSFAQEKEQSWTALGLYERMLEQAPSAMYEGIFVHQAGGQMQSVEIVHGQNEGEIWERLLHLDGNIREIIRRGDALYCINPDKSVEQIQQLGRSAFTNKQPSNLHQLRKAYEFRSLGQQRIAGRLVDGVQLIPKDASRHIYQLWLDNQTTVPLRTELVSVKGRVLERYQFSYFLPKDVFNPERFAPRSQSINLASAHTGEVLKTNAEDVLEWRLNWMPIGFEDKSGSGFAPKLSAKRIYSDGIVMFSVYVEQVEKAMDEGTAQAGPTALSVMHKQWQGLTHRITVVGEIPTVTAQRIAESVELL
ncbi:sigma factor AlgU regulator MucB [Oceaniserpentilla sp. 4NH20-0058]|uniref:MucB/RseB C-terminal domain-containing protein n=1 Tax=Oceaniserpentilla sp. 4NH20-0058 TaxID=3127660 RepID=UPI0031020849